MATVEDPQVGTLTVQLPKKFLDKLDKQAREEFRTRSDLVRKVLTEYLEARVNAKSQMV